MLDEALAAVVSGEVKDLYVVEGTFCGLFWACERFHDVARAEQWVRGRSRSNAGIWLASPGSAGLTTAGS